MSQADALNVAIIGALVGFGVYGISYAFHVWRIRNARLRRGASEGHSGTGHLALWSQAALATGLLCVAVAFAFRVAVDREGLLRGEGLFAVHVPEGMIAERVTSALAVKKSRGEKIGPTPPYGFKVIDARTVARDNPKPGQSATVQRGGTLVPHKAEQDVMAVAT